MSLTNHAVSELGNLSAIQYIYQTVRHPSKVIYDIMFVFCVSGPEQVEENIKHKLKEIMMQVDLDDVTCKYVSINMLW